MEQGCIGGSSTNIIYDLSGNVAEWENSCNATTGASDNCAVRGGSYDSGSQTTLTCALSGAQPPQPRSTTAADIGFRCCL
jgi:formylglycine-generating enzyme required for sulfatase activity